jgi:hypothetical protein
MGFPHWLGDSPRCSKSYHNNSYGARVPVIRDPNYSEGRLECPPRVWFSPQIDASNFTLRLLSHTPGDSQWLKFILLMQGSLWAVHPHGKQQFSPINSQDWIWEILDWLAVGVTIVPLLCGSNKRQQTDYASDKTAWSIYLTIRNQHFYFMAKYRYVT